MKKIWEMTEGALVCCGIVVAGLLLQLFVGPVRWDAMAWPTNIVVLAVMLLGILVMHLCRGKVRVFRWMSTLHAGIPAMLTCAMLTILMGVTRQVPQGHVPMEPIGITDMLSFWPFVLAYVWLMVLVGMVCMTRLRLPLWHNVPFLLSHLGIFIALVCGTLGNADMQTLHMVVQEGKTEWRAVDARHRVHELPVAIELHDFFIEQAPLRYMSDVTVYTKKGLVVRDTIQVNKPLSVRGWKIYQYSYDETKGAESDISIFEMVRDPWLPYVYLGIFMMLAGAVCLFRNSPKSSHKVNESKITRDDDME
ncbi:MAG: cytochrome c biogenesis protein ResB [Bacteroidaceae bacterium]|nr:cytochrome c biogenesis protein ResB [Bacteroidaceae bacterium]MBQ9294452.1 cytochrome c biogenesis protein ResB [Bacteroidaceae bacterium]